MPLPPLASVDDLELWLGASVDEARAGAVLAGVSSFVRSAAGRTWENEEVPADVHTVVLQAAARTIDNPTGASQRSVGDISVSGLPGAYLTADELKIIRSAVSTTSGRGLWTLSSTRGDTDADTVYVPVVGTETPFPWLTTDDV